MLSQAVVSNIFLLYCQLFIIGFEYIYIYYVFGFKFYPILVHSSLPSSSLNIQ